jgi:hypothetical protein
MMLRLRNGKKKSFLIIGIVLGILLGLISVIAQPDPGHFLNRVAGFPDCELDQYLAYILLNNGEHTWICREDPGILNVVQIYCHDVYGHPTNAGQNEMNSLVSEYWDEVNDYPSIASCPVGYKLVMHDILYKYGSYSDWNDVQHKTWYVKPDFQSNRITCKAYSFGKPSAVAGMGLCVESIDDSGGPAEIVPINKAPCNWAGKKCHCGSGSESGGIFGISSYVVMGAVCEDGILENVEIVDYDLTTSSFGTVSCPPPETGWKGCIDWAS